MGEQRVLRKRKTPGDNVTAFAASFAENCEGVAVGVVSSGKPTRSGLGPSVPDTYEYSVGDVDVFPLASLTKTFVGATAVIYTHAENARLSLDDDINTVLAVGIRNPHFPNTPITLRQLLSHRSSLQDNEEALRPFSRHHSRNTDSPVNICSYVYDRLLPGGKEYKKTLWGPKRPGVAGHHHSNAGITLAAFVLEVAAEMPFERLAYSLLFQPVGMTQTTLSVSSMIALGLRHPQHYFGMTEWPAAGGWSTLSDIMRYVTALTTGSAPFTSRVRDEIFPEDGKRGLGWWGRDATLFTKDLRDAIGTGAWMHGGYMQGVRAFIGYWPAKRAAAVILTSGENDLLDVVEALCANFNLRN